MGFEIIGFFFQGLRAKHKNETDRQTEQDGGVHAHQGRQTMACAVAVMACVRADDRAAKTTTLTAHDAIDIYLAKASRSARDSSTSVLSKRYNLKELMLFTKFSFRPVSTLVE